MDLGTRDLRDPMDSQGEHELQVYDDEDENENELEMRQILEEHNRNLKLQASQADSHLN